VTRPRLLRVRVACLTGAATVVLGAVLLVRESAGPEAPPSATRPTTAATAAPGPPPAPRRDLASVVDDPAAWIDAVTVRQGTPRVRSVIWRRCRTPRCSHSDRVLAVTDDGFATRHLVHLRGNAYYSPLDGVFVLGAGARAHIVRPGGALAKVDWGAGPPGPLSDGERLVGTRIPDQIHALNPRTGAGHRVSAPANFDEVVRDGDGLLRGTVNPPGDGPMRLATSTDGGRSWTTTRAPAAQDGLTTTPIASASTARALLSGGDGATLILLDMLHRSVDGGATWELHMGPTEPSTSIGSGLGVLPDGRLLLDLDRWSDGSRHHAGSRPRGLWVSAGQDWSDLRPIELGSPFHRLDLRHDASPVISIDVTRDRLTVYAVTRGPRQRLWSSTDAGRTWTRVRSR
jgi:hypothetical protein